MCCRCERKNYRTAFSLAQHLVELSACKETQCKMNEMSGPSSGRLSHATIIVRTRMHSSRMRTVRCSGRQWEEGGCLPRGVCPRGCLPNGEGEVCLGSVCLGEEGDVCPAAQGGVCQGVSARGVSARPPRGQNDRHV